MLPYQPGQFFSRGLPPPLAVLACVRNLGLLVIDGHTGRDPGGRPGPGAHAASGVPVTGVAKTRFGGASHAVEAQRGKSSRPLVAAAAGMPRAGTAALAGKWPGRSGCPAHGAGPAP